MDHETPERRYRETMEAIHLWVKSQKSKGAPEEALGIAKAFLTHASMAIVAATSRDASFSEADNDAAERLRKDFFYVALQFVEERTGERGN